MLDDEFEWDDAKAAKNLKRHNIRFETACWVYDDDSAIVGDDPASSDDEDRYFITGRVGDHVLTVIYTYRGERTRIISARLATKRETDDYNRG